MFKKYLENTAFLLLAISLFLLPFTKRIIIGTNNSFDLIIYSDFFVISIFLFQIPLYISLIFFLKNFYPSNKFVQYSLLFLIFIFIKYLLFKDIIILYISFLIFSCILIYNVLKEQYINQKVYDLIILIFLSNIIIQAFLSIFQWILQSNIGISILGETIFNIKNIGSAKFLIDNMLIIRSYGSFLHPNILAAFMLISIIFVYKLNIKYKKIFYLICILTIFASGSRIGILATLIFFLLTYFKTKKTKLILYTITFISIFTIIFSPILHRITNVFDESLHLRIYYYQLFNDILSKYFLIGLPNIQYFKFIDKTNTLNILKPWEYQFVHNSFILLISILGIVGSFLIFKLISISTNKISINITLKNINIILPLILFAFFEHNFITSIQILYYLTILISLLNIKFTQQY